MQSRTSVILMNTSFFPVAVFKVVARIGEASLAQAKVAVTIGLLLAGIQVVLSSKYLGHSTYLEQAFLGFLAIGTTWVYFTPPHLSSLFVDHSTTLLYLTLFSITLLPQLFGYDPFTYAIAKQWTPEAVWKTPQFRTINLHITYFWSVVFFLAALSCWTGHGKPLYSILLPLILVLGAGLPLGESKPLFQRKPNRVTALNRKWRGTGMFLHLCTPIMPAFNFRLSSSWTGIVRFTASLTKRVDSGKKRIMRFLRSGPMDVRLCASSLFLLWQRLNS